MNIKKAINNLLKNIDLLDPTGDNRKLYEDAIKKMSKSELEEWCMKIKNKELKISIIIPNGDQKHKITRNRLNTIYKKLGIKMWQKVTFTDKNGSKFQPPHDYNVLLVPVVRLNQHLVSKIGIAKNNYKRNPLTDQVTGDSKAGSITLPEMYVMNGLGLRHVMDEITSIRAGDRRAMDVMENEIITHGMITKEKLKTVRTKSSSTKRLKSYFKALHMDINI